MGAQGRLREWTAGSSYFERGRVTHLQIIVGSTRPGRVGAPVAEWFAEHARRDERFETELIDLADVALPILDEPNHPRLRDYTHPHTRRWSETIDRGDAYVFVIPEYNYALNAATKNSIDYLFQEWARKPLGIVSYGGVSGGLRAAQILKQVATALRMLTTSDVVAIHRVGTLIDDDGRFASTPVLDESARALLDELAILVEGSAAMR